MNAEQLNAIKERAEKATPGPWKWECETPYSSEDLISENGDNVLFGDSTQNYGYVVVDRNDAAFIENARQDIPELVAEVEYLTQVTDEYAQANKRLGEEVSVLIDERNDLKSEVERLQSELKSAAEFADYRIKHSEQLLADLVKSYDEIGRLKDALQSLQDELITTRGVNQTHDGEITGMCIRIRKVLDGGCYE